MILEYAGDDPNKNRMVSWFLVQLRSIATCVNADLPEAALTLIYSGIDTFGLLAAPPAVQDASGDTFKQWCDKYILPRVQPVEGGPVNAVDLWAAKCGVLHTSTPLSALERAGKAHQIWYRFLLGPGRGLTNMLSPPQEMLRPFIGNLKSRRVLIDVGYASYPAFFESHGKVVNVEAQRGHRRSHDEIHACVAVEPTTRRMMIRASAILSQ